MLLKILTVLVFIFTPSMGRCAEILVKAVDSDQSGGYKAGDPVVVMPDGHQWGKEEGYPKFKVVKVPDLSVADAKAKYLVSATERRLYKVDLQTVATKEKSGAISVRDFELSTRNKETKKTVSQEVN